MCILLSHHHHSSPKPLLGLSCACVRLCLCGAAAFITKGPLNCLFSPSSSNIICSTNTVFCSPVVFIVHCIICSISSLVLPFLPLSLSLLLVWQTFSLLL
eukprot:m.14518 g.14518  ORF g.14518 m.14518 type:complete len:100 (-) comp7629_c0_seq3:1996-2295(-)